MVTDIETSELQQITVEIKVLKHQTAQNIIEIGKRLKVVRDNPSYNGQWESWLMSIDIDPSTAWRMIEAYKQFGHLATSQGLSTSKVFEMLSLPESIDRGEFVEQSHVVPSTGESKNVDEMTVRELREVKQTLKRTKDELSRVNGQAADEYHKNKSLREENERLKREKNPEPIEVEKVIYKTPDYVEQRLSDYEITLADTRSKLESTKSELASLRMQNIDDFDPEQAKEKRQRLQLEADISTLQLKVQVDEFLSKTSRIAFMEGALASAEPGVKQKLMDAVTSVEKFLSTVKQALNSKMIFEEAQFKEV